MCNTFYLQVRWPVFMWQPQTRRLLVKKLHCLKVCLQDSHGCFFSCVSFDSAHDELTSVEHSKLFRYQPTPRSIFSCKEPWFVVPLSRSDVPWWRLLLLMRTTVVGVPEANSLAIQKFGALRRYWQWESWDRAASGRLVLTWCKWQNYPFHSPLCRLLPRWR